MRVLLAEPESPSRLALERELERLGHECLNAGDGSAAWNVLGAGDVEVVISLDDELGRWARTNGVAPTAYFIVHVSREDKGRALDLVEAGADDYLVSPIDPDELAMKLLVANRATLLKRRLVAQLSELERLRAAVLEDTPRDLVTGLRSRHPELEDLEILAARAERYRHSFSVALFDLDRFDSFNVAAGQRRGDQVLRTVARTLVRESRRGDAVYRHSGQQILVLLPYQEVERAAIAAERMREAIELLAIPHPADDAPGPVTASVGLASYEPGGGDEISKLLQRAEGALEAAKSGGRNRVVTRQGATAG